MKNVIFLALFVLFAYTIIAKDFVSTIEGGEWNNSKTWTNGQVPDSDSDVTINGKVIVENTITCKNILIMEKGTLEFAKSNDSLTAKIHENIQINDGTMIVNEKWNVFTKVINKTDRALLYNYSILTIGQ